MTPRHTTSAVRPATDATATPLPRILRPQRALPADAVRPTRAEVNLANLRHNLRVVERAAGGRPVWAVLKADGYGHGSKGVARTLERAGANGICVALLEEGIATRDQLDAIETRCRVTVDDAVQFAEESPWPEDSAVWEDIYV